MGPHEFLDRLIIFCALTGGSVTSYGRTPEHNRKEGGVLHSAHLVWLGADVVYDAPPPPEARKDWGNRLGVRVIVEDDHDHLQPWDWLPG